MKYEVKQIRSSIACPKKQKDTLLALGLGKIGRSKTVDVTDSNVGMLRAVQHLVSISKGS